MGGGASKGEDPNNNQGQSGDKGGADKGGAEKGGEASKDNGGGGGDTARTDGGGATTTTAEGSGEQATPKQETSSTSDADKKRIEELETKLKEAEEKLKKVESERDSFKAQAESKDKETDATPAPVVDNSAELEELKQKVSDLESKLAGTEQSLKDASVKASAAVVERDEAREQVSSLTAQVEDLKKQAAAGEGGAGPTPAAAASGPDPETQKTILKLQKQNEIIMKKLVEREGTNRTLQAQLAEAVAGGAAAASTASALTSSGSPATADKNFVENLKLNKIVQPDESESLFPSDEMGDKLRGFLGGDHSIPYAQVRDLYTAVPPVVLFDWFVQVCLQCKRLGKLVTLTQVVTKSLKTMEEMMADVTKETCELLLAERATVFASDPKKRQLYSKVAANTKHVKAEIVAKVDTGLKKKKPRLARTVVRQEAVTIRIPDDAGIAGFVYQNGDTVNIEDAYDDYRFNQEVDKKMGLRTKAVLCAGVTAHGGARMGVIQVMNKKVLHAKGPPTGDGEFTEEDEKKLESLALRVGIQLYRTQIFEDIKGICEVNLLLDDVMTSYVEEVSLQRTMNETSEEVCRLLDCERATVFMAEKQTEELFAIVGDGIEIRFPWDKGIAGECFMKKKSVNIPEPYSDSRFNPEFDKKNNFKTRSILCMPLYDNESKVIGVLQAINKGDDEEDYFTEEDEHYFRRTVTQAGANLAYAKMFEDAALL
eukprot:TRINITY_DN15857_c0_g1_i1.p1 TRINITY_DN15857_c0_g1~~TRINITY_DN15857_c0_g1_i1.p1  ORF type:complete len:712 (+),score=273.36 TRINITY_DN15857_c0_g1_i1:206-2341(+)